MQTPQTWLALMRDERAQGKIGVAHSADGGQHGCVVCGYVYDEAKGAPREGFPAGTAWDTVPDDWCCPDCAVREKIDFEELEISK